MKLHIEINEELVEKIISAAYGNGSRAERKEVLKLAKKDARVKELFDEYKSTAGIVHGFKKEVYPDELVEEVYRKVGLKAKPRASVREKIFGTMLLKPGYAAIGVTIAGMMIAAMFYFNQPEEIEPRYTRAEVEVAEDQLKESLAIISGVFKKTQKKLEKEILNNKVGQPIQKSFEVINNLLIGG